MVKRKDRFQVGVFLDTPVTLLMWQLLDRQSQLRVQLACAIASFRPTKRGKISAGPNPVGTAATASKFGTPPIIETIAHEDGQVICLYINARIGKHKINKTLVELRCNSRAYKPELTPRSRIIRPVL